MNFSRKTYYGAGVVSALLDFAGGVLLIFSTRMNLLFTLATAAAGAMMLLLAADRGTGPRDRRFFLAGAILTALGMMPGILGKVCAAFSWPAFAWPFFCTSGTEDALHKSAFLVIICGLVLLIGSFLPVPQMLGACIILAIAAAHGLLCLLLFRAQPQGGEEE